MSGLVDIRLLANIAALSQGGEQTPLMSTDHIREALGRVHSPNGPFTAGELGDALTPWCGSLDGAAGPRDELVERRVHDLFLDTVRDHWERKDEVLRRMAEGWAQACGLGVGTPLRASLPGCSRISTARFVIDIDVMRHTDAVAWCSHLRSMARDLLLELQRRRHPPLLDIVSEQERDQAISRRLAALLLSIPHVEDREAVYAIFDMLRPRRMKLVVDELPLQPPRQDRWSLRGPIEAWCSFEGFQFEMHLSVLTLATD